MLATKPTDTHRVKTSLPPGYEQTSSDPLAAFLGLFSLGLGLAEVAAPRSLARLTGVRFSPALIRAYGLREIAAGIGILTARRPAAWLWGRVAGDALDLATLGAAYAEAGGRDRDRVTAATAAVAGVTALDVICARAHSRGSDSNPNGR